MVGHDEVIDVATAMKAHGGSFVKSLGETLFHADPINVQKIHDAFPELWAEYKEIAQANKGDDSQ